VQLSQEKSPNQRPGIRVPIGPVIVEIKLSTVVTVYLSSGKNQIAEILVNTFKLKGLASPTKKEPTKAHAKDWFIKSLNQQPVIIKRAQNKTPILHPYLSTT
jgi:hypothetical protein